MDAQEAAGPPGLIEASLARQRCIRNSEPSGLRCFWLALKRKKPLDCRTDTNLNRCLNLLELTALGVGSTLGLGLYVLAGTVASRKAGPAVVVSFALAALASAFSALCYAEFAGLVPRAGSAYAYSYITVGEFVAFVIGWNLILEYVIGAASVARGFSGYLRHLADHLLLGGLERPANATQSLEPAQPQLDLMGQLIGYLAGHFDWPSVAIVLVITCLMLLGVKQSTWLTLAFTALNLLVVVGVVVGSVGSLELDNWRLREDQVPAGFGQGGFAPYGWSGVLAGASTCFFGFIGFDAIASSAEEARNPRRNVPLAILLSLAIAFLAYMAVACVQTLMWPYYDQDRITVLPYIFQQLQLPAIYWLVLLGALAGLASSQLGGMCPLPRVLYSMGQDRLIYGYLAAVNKRLKLPVRATLVGSLLVALLACLLELEELADMVSIGTLAAYSLVSLSVLLLRYEDRSGHLFAGDDNNNQLDCSRDSADRRSFADILGSVELARVASHQMAPAAAAAAAHAQLASQSSLPMRERGSRKLEPQLSLGFRTWFGHRPAGYLDLLLARRPVGERPDKETSGKARRLISCILVLCPTADLLLLLLLPCDRASHLYLYLAAGLILATLLLACLLLMLARLPQSSAGERRHFRVPLVPLVPTLSLLVNAFLMLNLSPLTWLRFAVWMAAGLFVYFTYGIWNSQGYLLQLAELG